MFESPEAEAVSSCDLDGLLADLLGPGATFRSGQREAIGATLRDGARVQVIERTGWGKSVVYWLATKCRRDSGHGPTLIISPLLSLMRDQIKAAARLGIRAVRIDSSNRDDWQTIQDDLKSGSVDVLMVSPERLANREFMTQYLPAIQGSIGLFVVDEVHCISDWGHDFRPDYRRIASILRALPRSVPVLGTTATANARVQEDIEEQFGSAAQTIRGPLTRRSLRLGTLALADQAERLAWLARYVPELPGSGIIYCLTVADTERVAGWLASRGISAHAYNSRLPVEEKEALEAALSRNEVKALVATVALGMGFDKPDLGFVVHYQRPGSVIAYYQQVGRAGRAVEDADAVLLSGREDDDIQAYFIRTAFPPAAQMEAVIGVLERVDTAAVSGLEVELNLPRQRLAAILKILEVEGAVDRDGSRYVRTLTPWEYDHERVDRVSGLREAELTEMRAYMNHPGCLMQFLTTALDDPYAERCGRCMNCRGDTVPSEVDHALVVEAATFLRGDHRVIEPRRMWPHGAVPGLSGRLAEPCEPGLALSIYGDAGWGRRVQETKYRRGELPIEMTNAAADAIRDAWRPSDADGWWVAAVPSWRRPGFVGDAARAIAARLELPYRDDVLSMTPDTPPQAEMENSAQQLRNVHGALEVSGEPLPGPVILIDDVVDSRWTLTMAGYLARGHGSGPVHPFAFAEASGGNA